MSVEQPQAITAPQASETPALDMPWPSEIAPILMKIEGELQAGRVKQALEILRRADISSPWMANALGVCQLRQGQAQVAVGTFRRFAFGPVYQVLAVRAEGSRTVADIELPESGERATLPLEQVLDSSRAE